MGFKCLLASERISKLLDLTQNAGGSGRDRRISVEERGNRCCKRPGSKSAFFGLLSTNAEATRALDATMWSMQVLSALRNGAPQFLL